MVAWTSPLSYSQAPTASREQLELALQAAGVELLSELGIATEREASFDWASAGWCDVVGKIGFDGPDISGTLVISMDWPLLTRSLPIPDADAAAKLDWIGELANMVLGFFKSLLVQRGLRLGLGLPTAASGPGVTLTATSPVPIGILLRAGDDVVRLGLDWTMLPDAQIADLRHSASPSRPDDDGLLVP